MAAGDTCGAHGQAKAQQPKRSTAVCRGRGHVGSRWRAEATAIAELELGGAGGAPVAAAVQTPDAPAKSTEVGAWVVAWTPPKRERRKERPIG